MRIVRIQKILVIFSLVIGLYSNTLKSMAFDYAQLACWNIVNTGVHMVADATSSHPLFSGLVPINYSVRTYCLLGACKMLYDMYLLHNKYTILSNLNDDNKSLTQKKGVNIDIRQSGLIQACLLYAFFGSVLYQRDLLSCKSALYFAAKTIFLVLPTIVLISCKKYDAVDKLDS